MLKLLQSRDATDHADSSRQEQQARAMLFRPRDLLIGQRTQMVNALRGHLAEHGIIVGKGLGNVDRLAALIMSDNLPELVQSMSRLYLVQIGRLGGEIDQIDRRIAAEARESDVVRRLQKMPGIGPICAMAITAFAPSMREFRCGRDFAPGSVLFLDNTRPEANRSSAARRRWVKGISGGS